MSILENRKTHSCDKYLSEWEEGRVQPIIYNSNNSNEIHWDFHYLLSEKCGNGQPGEQTIRYYCDINSDNTTLINSLLIQSPS